MRLLNLTLPEIQAEVEKLEQESKAFKKQLYKTAWYMRGSISMTEVWMLDIQDRLILNDIIEENLEITKETKLPFF